MTKKNIITINGRPYDAVTGLPIKAAHSPTHVAPATKVPVHSPRQAAAHRTKSPQRSQTLRREALKRPAGANDAVVSRQKPARQTVQKSPHIQKFAPHPTSSVHVAKKAPAQAATHHAHPSTVRAAHHRLSAQAPKPRQHQTSQSLKDSLIKESLHKAVPAKHMATHKTPKKSLFAKPFRASSVMAGSLAVVILGGYLTYISMPGISTRVAAAQAGVDASYPGYKPDGYRFKGPVAFDAGQVKVTFESNSGPQHFSINQRESKWDSQTVLDNYVLQESEDYTTNTSQGITVYTYRDGAAWVNGGVFYTLDGDATLSTEQVLRIANSL